jgi:dipeptidyl aminopeptidase/acylaminoacyl peptidase
MITLLINFGYNILIPTFSGSKGFGIDALEALPGNVGSKDVNEIKEAISKASEIVSTEKIVAFGGSYGGYLTLKMC